MYNRLLFPGRFMSGVVIRNRRIFALIAVAAFLFLAVGLFPASASISVNWVQVTDANAANVLDDDINGVPTVSYDKVNNTLYVNTSLNYLSISSESGSVVNIRDSHLNSFYVIQSDVTINCETDLNIGDSYLKYFYVSQGDVTINAKPLNIGELNATNSSDVTINASDVTFNGSTGLNLTDSNVTIEAGNVTFDKCGKWSIRTNGNSRVNITATSDLIFSECRALNAGAKANQGAGDYTIDDSVTLTGKNVELDNFGIGNGTGVGFQVRESDLTINADNLIMSAWNDDVDTNFGGMGIDARSNSTVEINVTGAFNITTFANCINLDHTSGITLDVKDLNLLSVNNYAIVMGMNEPAGKNTLPLKINAETVNLEAKFACISTWGDILINASKNVVMKSNGATEDDLNTNPDACTWGSCIQVAVGGDVEIIGKEVSMTAGYMGVNIDNGDLTINADKLQIDAKGNGLSAENGSVLINSSDVNINSISGRGISADSLTLDLNSTEVAGNATVLGGGDAGIQTFNDLDFSSGWRLEAEGAMWAIRANGCFTVPETHGVYDPIAALIQPDPEGGSFNTVCIDGRVVKHAIILPLSPEPTEPTEPPAPTGYTISASSSPQITMTPIGILSVSEGETVTYRMIPYEGWTVGEIIVDGVVVASGVNTYTFKDVSENHSIRVNAVKIPIVTAPFSRESVAKLIDYLVNDTPLDGNYDFDRNGVIDGRDLILLQREVA